ncbi:class I SAM-dependent methyltransferase [Kitasatospora sp. NPDC048296]|uniref:class I SAM-dependent methyltransferase n=1 Tax=Kitasatospora sp. NPDC048296 TaxID=3364048 RepID=UPI0037174DEE
MPFNHNDHYHRLLLRALPPGARRALDVGCGTGAFARALARQGVEVEAVDRDAAVIAAARALSPGIQFHQADVTELDLSQGQYDYISCLASLHHLPIDTLDRLREALAPNGVLVVLGCYREETARDRLISLAAVPVNAVCRLAVHLRERGTRPGVPAPVAMPTTSLAEVRAYAARHLPGFTLRQLLFWRYLLVYRRAR